MGFLDNAKIYQKFDQDRMAESIALLDLQIEQTVRGFQSLTIPNKYFKGIDKIVISGMGGSNLGFRIIQTLFKKELKVPLIVEAGYEVPGFVDSKTLYIISSYSGNTEEPLSTFKEVRQRKAKIIVLTSNAGNNKLVRLMKSANIPGFVFDPKHNPSGQPRIGLGYSIFGAIKLLEKAGALKIDQKAISNAISKIKKNNKLLSVNIPVRDNQAKKIATKLAGKNVIIVGAEFLAGNMHALRNQFNESSKNFASYLILPDLNHYALEGIKYPKSFRKNFVFLFVNSNLYHPRVRRRLILTQQILQKNKIEFQEIKLNSRDKLVQSFEVLQIGTWLTFYLALLNQQNPALIPNVDWFKKKLLK